MVSSLLECKLYEGKDLVLCTAVFFQLTCTHTRTPSQNNPRHIDIQQMLDEWNDNMDLDYFMILKHFFLGVIFSYLMYVKM